LTGKRVSFVAQSRIHKPRYEGVVLGYARDVNPGRYTQEFLEDRGMSRRDAVVVAVGGAITSEFVFPGSDLEDAEVVTERGLD